MFCPECGHPTDPAPFDVHKAAHTSFGNRPAAIRRAFGKFWVAITGSIEGRASLSPITAIHQSGKGSSMSIHHASGGEVMRLRPVSDPDVKTTALVKTQSFETVHLVVRAGESLPDHKVAGSISLYCIEGDTVVDTRGGERQFSAGDWLYLEPGAPHAVRGITDASLLLTILFDRPVLHGRFSHD